MKYSLQILFLIISLHSITNAEECPSTNAFGYCTVLGNHIPKIEVFNPKGIRVIVNDTPGLQKVSFRTNINKPIFRDDKGDYNLDLEKKDGKWIRYAENVQLKLADQVNFFLTVRENNKETKYFKKRILVKKIEPSPFIKTQKPQTLQPIETNNRCPPCNCLAAGHSTATATATATANAHNRQPTQATARPHAISPTATCAPAQTDNNSCNMVDLTKIIIKLENAQAAIESLTEVIEHLQGDKNLNIKGLKLFYQMSKAPLPGHNAVDLVKTFIVDNLDLIDLENEIAQASFVDGGILFEVRRNIDKMRILYRAIKMLANSKNKIIDPEATVSNNLNTTPKKQNNDDDLINAVFNTSSTQPSSNSDIDDSFWRADDVGIKVPVKKNS